jgi:RHS repeat-associated protein
MLTSGAASFRYDGNGNQLAKSTGNTSTTYSWDALNQLTVVTTGASSTVYQYDGDGNRIAEQVTGGTYAFVNDTATSLPSVLSEGGPDGSITYLRGLSLVSESAPAFLYYYQFDGLDSVTNATDASGANKASYSYDPWGNLASVLDLTGGNNAYDFTGEQRDQDGLIFLRARYYDPSLGRFLSPDPVRSTAGTYAYAANNPLSFIDPSGAVVLAVGLDAKIAAALGLSGQAAVVTDDKGNHGIALTGGFSRGIQGALTAGGQISVTSDGTIFDLRGPPEHSISLDVEVKGGGGLALSLGKVSSITRSVGPVSLTAATNGFTLSGGIGPDVGIAANTDRTWVIPISDSTYNLLAAVFPVLKDFDDLARAGLIGSAQCLKQ